MHDDDDDVTVVQGEIPGRAPEPVPPKNPSVKERRGYLGGSDAAAVLGLSKWKTPYQLYLEKRGEAPEADLSGSERVLWGNILEEDVAKEYCRRTGAKVRRVNGALFHHKLVWMGAHIDRLVLGEDKILEIKTTDGSRAHDWDEGVPDYYLPQVMHYLAVTGKAACDVAVLIGGNELRIFPVPRDEEFIANLIEAENRFWAGVLLGEPPAAETSAEANARFAKFIPGAVFGSHEDLALAAELKRTREDIKSLERLEDELETKLKTRIGEDGDALVVGTTVVATWKSQSRTGIDTKALEADHPEIAAQYRKVSTFRKFALKGE
jgi:putative phage-type endonuclease